jgi:hypothetical protein
VLALFGIALWNIWNATDELRDSTVPLYRVTDDGETAAFRWNPDATVTITMEICLDDSVPQTTIMAQTWGGIEQVPGSLRVFSATPGCNMYTFGRLPAPYYYQQDTPGQPCADWTVNGVLWAVNRTRPVDEFRTTVGCVVSPKAP